jgi:sporulation protein YlmC with PRC-barrel domain
MNYCFKQLTICAALAGLALPLSAADTGSQQTSSQQRDQSIQSGMNPQTHSWHQRVERDCSARNILNASARSKDGKDLGQVEDLLVNPRTGKADFIVLGETGVQGTGEDFIPVPWQAVKMRPDGSVAINKDKADLKTAPSLKKDYSNLNQPGYTVTLYEFYAVPANGNETAGGISQGSGAAQLQEVTVTNRNENTLRNASRTPVH